MTKTAAKKNEFRQDEIDFLLKSKATNNNEFAKEYVARFGMPDSYTRPVNLFFYKKKYEKQQKEMFKKRAHEKLVDAQKQKKSGGESAPAGGSAKGAGYQQGSGKKDMPMPDVTESMVNMVNLGTLIERVLVNEMLPVIKKQCEILEKAAARSGIDKDTKK